MFICAFTYYRKEITLLIFRYHVGKIKRRIRILKDRVVNYVNSFFQRDFSPRNAALVVSVISGISLFLYFHRRERLQNESLSEPLIEKEEKMGCSTGYPRYKNKVDNNLWVRWYNDFTPSHKGDFSSGVLNVLSSMRMLTIFVGDKFISRTGNTMGFGLCRDIMVLNRHCLGPDLNKCTINVHSSNQIDDTQLILNLSDIDYLDIGRDLVLIRHPSLRFKDRLKHFVSSTADIPIGSEVYIDGFNSRLSAVEKDLVVDNSPYDSVAYDEMYRYSWPNHRKGKCGTPLICMVGNGQCIIGIHSAGGSHSHSLAVPVDKQFIEDAIEKFDKISLRCSVLSESHYSPVMLSEPHSKSPFLHEHLPQLKYIGKCDKKIMVNNTSNLTRSFYAPHLKHIFKEFFGVNMKPTHSKPLMRPVVTKNGYLSPFNNWLIKTNHVHSSVSKSLLSRTEDIVTNHFISNLEHLRGKLSPITIECAINGIQEDHYIDRMSSTTSAGFGWPGKKEKYIPLYEGNIREMVPELEEKVDEVLNKWKERESVNPIYTGQLKDEPRPIEKCMAGKTRMFFCYPYTHDNNRENAFGSNLFFVFTIF